MTDTIGTSIRLEPDDHAWLRSSGRSVTTAIRSVAIAGRLGGMTPDGVQAAVRFIGDDITHSLATIDQAGWTPTELVALSEMIERVDFRGTDGVRVDMQHQQNGVVTRGGVSVCGQRWQVLSNLVLDRAVVVARGLLFGHSSVLRWVDAR